jgi:AAA15 family ATPase/GTPase
MLLQFTVKNYKVFGDEVKLNMIASADDTREEENVIVLPKFGLRVLKSAVMYGANASGKSKLIEAMQFMKHFILTSAETQSSRKIKTVPFRLNTATENAPSSFEIVFILNNEMYRYGFEVTSEKVVSEWLFHRPKTKEVEIFYRQEQDFEIHKNFDVQDLVDKKRIKPNTLLLSKADAENDELASKITKYVSTKTNTISGLEDRGLMAFTIKELKESSKKNEIIDLLKFADIGIEDVIPNILDIDDLPKNLPKSIKTFLKKKLEESEDDSSEIYSGVNTFHNKYDENDNFVGTEQFSMEEDESSGTKKYFAFLGPILNTLSSGKVLIIDELDAKLHPNLVHKIVEIFNSKTANPNNAQLIFNTHDTNLLSCGLFRRDQIWFVEKNRYGSADLFSLSSFKTDTVRKNDNFEKNYIAGRYGAIPYLGDFDKLFNL